jgi:hypothetical protein
MMHRLWLILPPLLLLASCADAPPPTPLPGPHVTISFPAGSVVNVIKIEVVDNLPLRAAELVAPDGTATPAGWLDVQRNIQDNSGQYAVDTAWHNPAFVGAGPVLPNVNSSATYLSHDVLLLMTADAEITLPDPVVYRRDWQHYRIRLTFGAPGGADVREVAAPAPPAAG